MGDTTDALRDVVDLLIGSARDDERNGLPDMSALTLQLRGRILATPAGSASGEAWILCHRLHTSDGKNAWRWVNGAPNEQAKDDARNFGWPLELAYSGEYIAALQAEVARLTSENKTLERNLVAAMDAVHRADKEAETAGAALAEALRDAERLVENWERAAKDLRGDGCYTCCAGTYEHCAAWLKAANAGEVR